MSDRDKVIALLTSIDASMKALVRHLSGSAVGAVAPDRDLDGKYGDPELRFNPRDWTGPSYKGRRFSECPPDLLDMVAETLEYFAGQSDEKQEVTERGKPVGDYKRADAARARGWAKRNRAGKGRYEPETGEAMTDAGWASEADGFR